MRVLVAEDDPICRRIIESAMSRRGNEVTVTGNGKEAWEILSRDDAPLLALIDWMMPGMDGIDVCRKVREKKNGAYIYIILITAKSGVDDMTKGLYSGADDYIIKPFNARELHARVRVGERLINIQNQLMVNLNKLKELDGLKTEFVSTVSHELRTPIAIVKQAISLCLDGLAGDVTEKQSELLKDALENSERLGRLVTDLLDVSKLEAGKIRLRRNYVDMCDVVRKVVKAFDYQAKEKNITLLASVPDHEIKMFVDTDKMVQIYQNLVSNALRFTEPGGTITVGVQDGEDEISCSVSDTGKGIAKENQRQLFSKFAQFGRVEGPGYKGTGLGLFIVKG
ncbi:hypothetical protein BVY01_01340, partial [bacterium I07]